MKSIRVNNTGKKRKAGLSNVVGSLLLIILTIIAALLLGHFVFGLFASNSHNAGLRISDVSVIQPGGNSAGPMYVTLTVTNNGDDSISLNTVTLALNSASSVSGGWSPSTAVSSGNILRPGQSVTLTTTLTGYPSTVGTGNTVVFSVTATDQATGTSLSTQASTVIAD